MFQGYKYCTDQWLIQDIPDGGCQVLRGDAKLWQDFVENWMKMKKKLASLIRHYS